MLERGGDLEANLFEVDKEEELEYEGFFIRFEEYDNL